MNVRGKAVLTFILASAVLAFPVAAMADNSSSNTITWFSNISTAEISDSGGTLSLSVGVNKVMLGNGNTLTGSLGSISLTSGTLVKGSLATGCVNGCSFSFADSSFKISGAGGAPSWTGEITPNTDVILSLVGCARGTCTYDLTAQLSSLNGQSAGSTVLAFTTKGIFTGSGITTARAVGLTNITVPEPGTLGLLGVSLFCVAGVLRRKLIRS